MKNKNIIRNNETEGKQGGTELKKKARLFIAVTACIAVIVCAVIPVLAGDPITVVSNLSTFIFGLIRAVGIIILAWGVVQVGMSFQSHDPSQRSQGFLTLAGGLVITFAKEILTLIGIA